MSSKIHVYSTILQDSCIDKIHVYDVWIVFAAFRLWQLDFSGMALQYKHYGTGRGYRRVVSAIPAIISPVDKAIVQIFSSALCHHATS